MMSTSTNQLEKIVSKTTEQYEAEIRRLMQDVDIALDQAQAALQSEFKAWQKVDVLNERIKGYEAMIVARDSRFIELHAAADKLIDINNEQRSKIEELERELAEVRKDAWQPIETAPKDGTEVFLWLPSPYNRIEKARWFDLWENWQLGEFPDDSDEYCGIGSALPTHWMPLPTPPAASVAQANKEQGNG